jgi:hypothetical protein
MNTTGAFFPLIFGETKEVKIEKELKKKLPKEKLSQIYLLFLEVLKDEL